MFKRTGFEPVTLSFTDVPNVGVEDMEDVLKDIQRRKELGGKSFGAFVVRGAGVEAVSEGVRVIRDVLQWRKYIKDDTFDDESSHKLHTDDGAINDMTFHWTKRGQVMSAVLTGVQIPYEHGFIHRPRPNLPRHGREVIHYGVFHGPEPDQAFRTMLKRDDVLVFDHTQPHAFISESSVRESAAFWF
jgi:hypothetical protein